MRIVTSTRLVLAGGLLALGALAFAGPLDPPAGPISPSFKTLTEVEPRTPVQSLPGSDEAAYVISQPGSYYLTSNLTSPEGKSGIQILADHVTIDLNGFTIEGADSSFRGVVGWYSYTTLKNGTIRWCEEGGVALYGSGVIIDNVRVDACGPYGIIAGVRSKLTRCVVHGCEVGFAADNASTLEHCDAYGNSSTGFEVAPTSTVRACLANGNSGDGFKDVQFCTTFIDCVASFNSGVGFNTREHSVFTNCQALGNAGSGFSASLGATFTACSASRGLGHGFEVGQDALIQDCSSMENQGHGILIVNSNRVLRCSVSHIVGANSVGIYATGGANFIDECNVNRSRVGVVVAANGNKLTRNVCTANTTNWQIVAGNFCYVVANGLSGAINGNSGGVAGVTDAAANFSY